MRQQNIDVTPIQGHRKLVCAFANPLEIDNHNKTEAGAIMEGKYWKRKMATILAEYKRWRYRHLQPSPSHASLRIFYKNQNDAHDESQTHTNRVFYKTPTNINGVPPHDIADIGETRGALIKGSCVVLRF